MKGRVLIIVLLALVVSIVETYYRLQDPTNYLRPTKVLSWLDSQLTDILTYTHPFIQDWVAVVGHSIHLVLRPFYGGLGFIKGEISWVFMAGPLYDLLMYICSYFLFVLWVRCIYEESQKVTVKKEPTPIYDKMLSEGNVLKLQGEVQRLTLQNQRLGKELDRVCALLKKEGAGVTF